MPRLSADGLWHGAASPYAWPGALPASSDEAASSEREDGVKPPPLPQYMLPTRISIATTTVPAQGTK